MCLDRQCFRQGRSTSVSVSCGGARCASVGFAQQRTRAAAAEGAGGVRAGVRLVLRPARLRRPRRRPRPEQRRALPRGDARREAGAAGATSRPRRTRTSARTSTSCSARPIAQIEGSELNERLLLPFTDVGQLVFQGEQAPAAGPDRAGAPREGARAPAALRRPRAGQHRDHDAGAPAVRGEAEQPGAAEADQARSRAGAAQRRHLRHRHPPAVREVQDRRRRARAGRDGAAARATTPRGCASRRCCRTRAPTTACRRSCMRSSSSRSASTSRRSS